MRPFYTSVHSKSPYEPENAKSRRVGTSTPATACTLLFVITIILLQSCVRTITGPEAEYVHRPECIRCLLSDMADNLTCPCQWDRLGNLWFTECQ